MKTIHVTPTWRAMLPVLIELALNAETLKARQTAMQELERMADIADRAVAESKRKTQEG